MIYGGPLKSNPRGGTTAQSYRFPKTKYTAAAARDWLKSHNVTAMTFEPASASESDNMNTNELKLLEEDVDFSEATFDAEKSIVRNVVLLKSVSKHGYKYRESAMQKGAQLYEGAQAFIGHPSTEEERTGRRDPMRLAGTFGNCRFEAGKIKGDATLLPDEYGLKFLNIAKLMPGSAACSHIAEGKAVKSNGEVWIEEITRVHSVDLVHRGATTESIFESLNKRKEHVMEYTDIKVEELRIRRADIVDTLTVEGQKSRDDEVTKLAGDNKKLTEELDEFKVKEALAEKRAKVDKLLESSDLPKEAKTEVFRQQLVNVESEKFEEEAKKLIEDRKALLGGVKNMGNEHKQEDGDAPSNEQASSAIRQPVKT